MNVQETQEKLSFRSYYLLTKPGILMGNGFVAAASFCLASKESFNFLLFLALVTGLGFVIAASCVFNNCIDKAADAKMERTKNRPLVTGAISLRSALLFGSVSAVLGFVILAQFTNWIAFTAALLGAVTYVLLYSFAKYFTSYGTLIGSFSGAMPPVVGYTAASNQLDAGAFLLFLMLIFWQMPHFFAISIYRMKEYQQAEIPIHPIEEGILSTKRQMFVYSIAFLASALLLSLYGGAGPLFGLAALIMGVIWSYFCYEGFKAKDDILWGKKVFRFSLLIIVVLSVLMLFPL